jgi:hypothetical protein
MNLTNRIPAVVARMNETAPSPKIKTDDGLRKTLKERRSNNISSLVGEILREDFTKIGSYY